MEGNDNMEKKAQIKLSVCGSDCGKCSCYGSLCKGCHECEGKVFHQPDGKACAIYECVVSKNGLNHCGTCNRMPCEIWMKLRDPQFSDEQFEENVRMRTEALKSLVSK